MTPDFLSSHQDDSPVMSEINTTPLIDVMLVLLIMLIITLPVPTQNIGLDLPLPTDSLPPIPPAITQIDIAADGRLRWNGETLPDRAALEARLSSLAHQQPQPEIHLSPADETEYGDVAAVLAPAQRLGLTRLALLDRWSDSLLSEPSQ